MAMVVGNSRLDFWALFLQQVPKSSEKGSLEREVAGDARRSKVMSTEIGQLQLGVGVQKSLRA